MKRPVRIQNLGGAQAIILHRPHPTVQALTRQLTAIGLNVVQVWPDLDASALGADFVFFDADMGHDGQFPWAAGASPMPMIALIGSEAPGRIEWSLEAGAHAQMLKPVGDNGAYATLLVARATFDAQAALSDEIAGTRIGVDYRESRSGEQLEWQVYRDDEVASVLGLTIEQQVVAYLAPRREGAKTDLHPPQISRQPSHDRSCGIGRD